MKRENMLKIENYFEAFLIISLISLFLYLIKDFLFSIFLASTLVFIFYKPYQYLSKKINSPSISAIFFLFLTISLILLPSYLIANSLISQTSEIITSKDKIFSSLNLDECKYEICEKIKNNILFLNINLELIIKKIGEFLINAFNIQNIFNSITNFFINLFIFVLAFYYLLKDGDKFLEYIKKIIPMKNEYKEALFKRFKQVTLAVFIDSILVAIIQGILVGIAFYAFSIKSPIFWAAIASFFALIPIIGPAIVWLPAVIYLIMIKNYIFAISLFFYGLIIVSLSDNIIRAILMKRKIQIHPFLILISILGGMQLFGFFGIFLGPIIISLLIAILSLYKLDFR